MNPSQIKSVPVCSQLNNMHSSADFSLQGIHANIRTESVLEDLFNSLDIIPIDELEQFINQYKK